MSILLRVASVVLLFSRPVCGADGNAVGRWEGSIQIPGRELPLIVDLDQAAGKDWRGSIIIPGVDVKGAPLSDLSVGGSEISFTIKGALTNDRTGPAKFQGRVIGAEKIAGDFFQAGNSAPFEVRKTGPPQVELPRQSTPISQELEGEWKGDYEMGGYPRHVTLTLANHKPGAASAQLVIVGKKATNAPVELLTEEGGFVTIKSPQFGITYEGRFRKESGEISGTFALGPFEVPLILRRTSAKAR